MRLTRAPFHRGFTLIEVLVALVILSVLAVTAWRGMDAIGTSRQIADGNLKRTLRLQSVMTQFEDDLGQVMDTMTVPGMQFDGVHLRMTRQLAGGMAVVVWYQQHGKWLRWTSPVTSRVGDLQRYWVSSYQLQGQEPGTLVALDGVDSWAVFCYRGGALSNCQSSGDVSATRTVVAAAPVTPPTATTPGTPGTPVTASTTAANAAATAAAGQAAATNALLNREQLPNAVRCKLKLGEGSGFSGIITRDVLLAPQINQM